MSDRALEQRTCPQCGEAAGPLRLCNGCWLRGLQSQIDLLTAETLGPKEGRNGARPGEPETATPVRALPARRWLIAGTTACLALAAVVAAWQPTSPSAAPGADRPAAGGAGAGAVAPPLVGRWRGDAMVRYEDGTRDRLEQAIDIARLEVGKGAGFAVGVQGRTRCNGPLRFLSQRGRAYRFAYRELNTAECVATSRIELTPRGSSRLDYREVTNESVNRGTLAAVDGGTVSPEP